MEELKNDLVNALNGHEELPLAAKFYILKDVYRDVEALYYRSLQEQKNKQEEKPDEQNISKD